MRTLRAVLKRDRFATLAGVKVIAVREGYARARMRIGEEQLNGFDIVQGGAIFTLADLAFAAAANSRGNAAVAINVNIAFFEAAAKGGVLTAEAREVAVNPKLSTCSVRVTDARGSLVALFTGTAYRKKETVEEMAKRTGAARPRSARGPRLIRTAAGRR